MAHSSASADDTSMLSLHRPGALLRQLGLDTVYLLLALPMGILTFTVVVTGWSLALGLAITLIGLPIAMITIHVSRWMAWLERRRAALVLGETIPGVYRSSNGKFVARLKALFSDPSTWKDLAWHLLLLPVGIADFVIVVTAWSATLGLVTMPAWWWALPKSDPTELGLFQVDSWGNAFLAMAIGILLLPLAAALVRGTAAASGALSRTVLGPSRRQLEERVEVLAQTRAGAVDAAAAELQPHRARPARRCAGAAGRAGARPRHGRGALRSRSGGRPRARRQGARRGAAGDGRAARPRARHPPGDARPSAAWARRSARSPRARRCPPPSRSTSTGACPRRSSRRLLHRRRGADQRGQARPRAATRCAVARERAPARRGRRRRRGGADPTGRGLDGLHKRLAALDGTLAHRVSPPGGPTVLYAEVPCAS